MGGSGGTSWWHVAGEMDARMRQIASASGNTTRRMMKCLTALRGETRAVGELFAETKQQEPSKTFALRQRRRFD